MSDLAKRRPLPKGHWYRIYVGSCPVCQRNAGYRERVTDRARPDDYAERVVYLSDRETYDYCNL